MQRVFDRVFLQLDAVNGNLIQWILTPGFTPQYPFQFVVQASATIDFSEILYTINANDNFYVRDQSNIKQSWAHSFYYRVQLTTSTGTTYYSEAIAYDQSPTTARKYRMAADIQRKNNIRANFAGFTAWLLKRKYQGAVDLYNVDPVTEDVLNMSSPGYGTGIAGGYYNPVMMFFVVVDSAESRQLSPDGIGTKETQQYTVQTQGFPAIEEQDIIVKSLNNQRYNVDGVARTVFPGTEIPLLQKLSILLIPITSELYQIPVPPVPPDLTPYRMQPLP